METTIDRAGRIVVPKAVRDAAGLAPGTVLSVSAENGAVVLRPLATEPSLVLDDDGILFYAGEVVGSIEEILQHGRVRRTPDAK